MTEVTFKLEDVLPLMITGTILAIIYALDGLMLISRKQGDNETDKEKHSRQMVGFIKIIIALAAAGFSWYWYMNMKNKAHH
jgi:phospholipase C